MRQKLLLLAAVIFGILAFVFTYHQIAAEKRRIMGSAQDVALIKIKKPMTEGDKISSDNIELFQTKRFETGVTSEISWKNKDDIIGKELMFPKQPGTILTWNDLKVPYEVSRKSGLAGKVRKGQRAISIAVDATSSVTGLIRPDNNVDIIGTFRFPDMKGDSALDTITMTILQNVKILATGTDLNPPNDLLSAQKAQAATKGYSTVTLALYPKEVEMIVFASQKGRLTLSLRAYEETGFEENIQSVNFNYLQSKIDSYMKERRDKK